MPPKENPERACEECIHFFACSRQCGEPMAQSSATGCECYETVKSSMAYYVGTLDGAKGKIPNRLRELAEADKDKRVVVLPCKVGEKLWVIGQDNVPREMEFEAPDIRTVCTDEDNLCMSTCNRKPDGYCAYRLRNDGTSIGKNVFLTREEAEKALQEMEGKKDG
jgi:hypothetical protein